MMGDGTGGYIADHAARADALIPAWAKKTYIRAFVRALANQVQVAEDMLQDLVSNTRIDGATGAQLDLIGRLLATRRDGLDDVTYRRFLDAAILVRKSQGEIERVTEIARRLTGAARAQYVPAYPAACMITVYVPSPVDAGLQARIYGVVLSALPAGVDLVIVEAPSIDVDDILLHDVTPGHDGPGMPKAWSI